MCTHGVCGQAAIVRIMHWLVVLVCLDAGCLVLDAVFVHWELIPVVSVQRIFDVTLERSVPTWYSSVKLLAAGGFALLLGVRRSRESAGRFTVLGWYVFGAFFVLMSMDDVAMLHERIGHSVREIVSGGASGRFGDHLAGYPGYMWQIVLGPLFALCGLALLIFVWRQARVTGLRVLLICGLSLYACAVLLDVLDGHSGLGLYRFLSRFTSVHGGLQQHMVRALEEFLELVGTSCFVALFAGCHGSFHDTYRALYGGCTGGSAPLDPV